MPICCKVQRSNVISQNMVAKKIIISSLSNEIMDLTMDLSN